MTQDKTIEYLHSLLRELCRLPNETEWVEFKHNNKDPKEIGEYISALANSAALYGKLHAYMVWGVRDEDHAVVGTTFKPSVSKLGNEERMRACYMHCVLKYVNREAMNNTSLRERFGVEVKNSAMISRIIKQACDAGLVKPYDADAGTKALRYVPYWA